MLKRQNFLYKRVFEIYWLLQLYLGDMSSSNGGASEAVSTRISSAWKKFAELAEVLNGKPAQVTFTG